MKNDYNGVIYAYNHIMWTDWRDSLFVYFTNLFFNSIDIYYEILTLKEGYNTADWSKVGTYGAKIISDLLLKSPIMIQWNY